MGPPVPDRRRQLKTEPMPPPPHTASSPPGDIEGAQESQINIAPAGHAYLHALLSNAQFLNVDAYSKDSKHNQDLIPDLWTNEGTSTA